MPHPYLKGRPGLNPLRFKDIVHLPRDSFAVLLEIENNLNRFFKLEPPEKPPKELKYGDFTFVAGEKFHYEAIINEKDFKRITGAVGIARRNARIVIVSIHQHMGFNDAPLYSLEKFARACIDQGADAVFGTGPHRLWGIEIYKNKPIFYSLGNFLFHGGSFGAYPAETYEKFGLPPDTRDPIVFEEGLLKKIPYFTKDFLYESIVPVITFEKGNQVTGIKLYPIHFEKDAPLYQQGTPLMAGKAKGESIIKKLVKLSQRYDTKIVFRDGVGVIEFVSDGQGALFEKTAPWTVKHPQKLLIKLPSAFFSCLALFLLFLLFLILTFTLS
ncbi:MAG: CapA family protein [Candidatus Aminicenantes bacterium]|nr:MAG: CapA family protein [Candidatus Aminicenantes bacterium]